MAKSKWYIVAAAVSMFEIHKQLGSKFHGAVEFAHDIRKHEV